MQRYRMAYVCVVAAFAGCVSGTDTTKTADTTKIEDLAKTSAPNVTDVPSTHCDVVVPATPYWDGKNPPKPTEDEVFAMYRDPDVPDEWIIMLANPVHNKILWIVRVNALKNPSSLGKLVHYMDVTGQLDVPHTGPCCRPPGPVIPPTLLAAQVLEWETRKTDFENDVSLAIESCTQQ
jgi:hypothetical protein